MNPHHIATDTRAGDDAENLQGLSRLLRKPATAPAAPAETARMFTATVTRSLGNGDFDIQCADGDRLQAKRSFDCLVVPEPQDRIHGMRVGHRAWILHILERPDPGASTVLSPQGAGHMRLECESLQLRAETLTESAVRKTTVVENHHSIDAGSLGLHVDNHLSLKGELATLNASALIRMNAAQIHMG